MSAAERERRAKIRQNIREYYEFASSVEASVQRDVSPDSSPHSPASAMAADAPSAEGELDLDSSAFNPTKYINKMLREKTLRGLYEEDTALRRKVRELDGDLQGLVYDNYSKFITATDTIRALKSSVADMDSKLYALLENVESIDSVSQRITSSLQSHRAKIDEMVAVNSMLQKIQFLIELPTAMQAFIAKQQYNTAVTYWVAGDSILKKYSSIQSFERTHAECQRVAEELYRLIEDAIRATPLTSDKVDDVQRHIENLRKLMQTSISIHLDDQFDMKMMEIIAKRAKADFDVSISEVFDAQSSIEKGQMSVLRSGQSIAPIVIGTSLDMLHDACAEYKVQVVRATEIVILDDPNLLLLQCAMGIDTVVRQYLDMVSVGRMELHRALVQRMAMEIASGKEGEAHAQFENVAALVVSEYKGFMSIVARSGIESGLVPGDLVRSTRAFADELLMSMVNDLLAFCINYADCQGNSGKTPEEKRSAVRSILAMAGFARVFAKAIADVAPEMRATFDEASRKVCYSFIPAMGLYFCAILRTSMDSGNWTSKKDPTDASGVAVLLVDEWEALATLVLAVIPLDPSNPLHLAMHEPRSSTGSGRASASRASGARRGMQTVANFARREQYSLTSDVDRLFSRSSGALLFRPSTLDCPHIVEACIVYALKGFVEVVRTKTFNRGGLQQLQVDASFMLLSLAAHSGAWFRKEDRLVELINEVVGTAYDRSTDRVALSAAQTESIARGRGKAQESQMLLASAPVAVPPAVVPSSHRF